MVRAAGSVHIPGTYASEAEAKYRTLVENIPLVVYIDALDDVSSNLYTNPQCIDLLGYTPEEWREDPEIFARILHPEDRDRVLAETARGNHTGIPLRIEYRLLAKDGRVVWLRDDSVVIREEDGRPLFRQGFLLDLTQQKETERALRNAEQRYRSLVEQVPLAIYTNAADGRLLFMSSQIEDICGHPAAELMADPEIFWRLIHPDDRGAVRRATDRSLETQGEFSLEYRLVARDGRVVWVLDQTSPTLGGDGETLYRQGILADITEEKRRAEALALSEERFRSAFDHGPIGMALVSPEGRWLRVNEALCNIVGYSEEELLERTFQDITHPDDLEAELAHVRRLLADEVRYYELEKRYVHRDGRLVWVMLSVSLVRDAEGEPLHFISQIQDITGRRHLEEALRQSQKMEAVGRLAGGIAHDFNNLLTAISGYSELILERHSPNDRDRKNAEQIRRSAERAAQLTAQLLAFSRRQVLQPQEFRFDDAVAGIGDMLRRLIGEHVVIRTELGAGQAYVRADRTQIEQVVVNLAVNARDAMPGGGRLSIATSVGSVPVPAWPETELEPGLYVVLEVSDTGEGMDAGTQAQVFEPFFTTKPVGEGTGLGLATVYGTVKQSGGDVTVTSMLGRGATFRVLLPLADAPAEPVPETTTDTAPDGTETILLAEDEDIVRALVRELLEARGYAVLEAAHPEEALELARAHAEPLDLLLTDVVMPGMSGQALAKQVAVLRPDLPVLYTSAYTNGRIADRLGADGEVNFIQKPFSAEELATKVRAVLDGRALGRPGESRRSSRDSQGEEPPEAVPVTGPRVGRRTRPR
jgi:two-component system cell cycle sensor histidine kinase/response regulator CckA